MLSGSFSPAQGSRGRRSGTRFIDTHLHLWDRDRFDYDWLRAEPALPRRFLPTDLAGEEPAAAVFVQAGCAPDQGVAEAHWVADIAARWPVLRAVVAFAPLELGVAARQVLDELSAVPLVRGVRRLLQDESDEWLERPQLVEGLRLVADAGLVFDACIRHAQLSQMLRLRRLAPQGVIVLDHLGKPPVAAGWRSQQSERWKAGIQALAREPNTVVKLSGIAPEAGPGPIAEQARPFLLTALEAFGPARSMAGSDWPVSAAPSNALSYRDWFALIGSGLGLDPAEREAVLGGTGDRVYGLGSGAP